jgi:alpha-glucan,water dikinase
MPNSEKIATRHGDLEVGKKGHARHLEVALAFHLDQECLFHWGLSPSPEGPWHLPPKEFWPDDTRPYDDQAVQTPVSQGGAILIKIEVGAYAELPFVLYYPQKNEWDNNHGKNYRIRLSESLAEARPLKEITEEALENISAEIIRKETGKGSWTLMHRYNFCYELLDRVGGSREGLALLFVWLRFSALRQLDWQRNFNTKPRELSHAQQRLTSRLAQLYTQIPPQRDIVRLMLATMGHSGEGQRIRDEILEIMHRYGIKEVSEIFMEQWHQKMHNNTTPDDIIICEAYLAFLRSHGDPDAFYTTLEASGITKDRLEGFERPIKARPDFYPDKKDGMIHDFEHFLGTLKSVHSATDLGSCIQAARGHFDEDLHQLADFIWGHRDAAGAEAISLLEKVTTARHRICTRLESHGAQPEFLCLDVSLEDFVRTLVERNMQSDMGADTLMEWLARVMDNFLLAHEQQDLTFSLLQWDRLWKSGSLDLDLILQAESVVDRIERTVAHYAHGYQSLFQPKAELLGKPFGAEPWSIRLFSEAVMRGGLAFSLSAISRHLRRILRRKAKLTSWQPMSRGGGIGRVEVMDNLDAVQGKRFDPPVIIVSGKIRGDEDLPEGTLAVLTSSSVDVVSHLAIRARNQGVLLATCYDPGAFEKLKSLEGRFMDVETDASGDLRFESAEEGEERPGGGGQHVPSVETHFAQPPDAPYALTAKDFREQRVGGKSLHLHQLKGKLPDWIHLPTSVALPFGAFEKVLKEEINREISEHYERLLAQIKEEPKLLPEIRTTILKLMKPDDLDAALRETMKRSGLRLPESLDKAWSCIKME